MKQVILGVLLIISVSGIAKFSYEQGLSDSPVLMAGDELLTPGEVHAGLSRAYERLESSDGSSREPYEAFCEAVRYAGPDLVDAWLEALKDGDDTDRNQAAFETADDCVTN